MGHFAVSVARRMASEIDEAWRREVERSSELASEKERNAAHRMIHDSALQTLEALSRDTALSPEEVRAIATAEAATLRRSITDGDHEPASLIVSLRRLVDRFDRRGLKVRLVTEDTTFHPDPTVTTALCDAVGEALTNVCKHAEVDRVVVRLEPLCRAESASPCVTMARDITPQSLTEASASTTR